jgi:hypothetical protein
VQWDAAIFRSIATTVIPANGPIFRGADLVGWRSASGLFGVLDFSKGAVDDASKGGHPA